MESYVYQLIPLAEISREFPYASRYSMKDALLWDSVARRGVLKPVVVSSSVIVSGHKRFFAAEAAGLSAIPAFRITQAKSAQDLYLLAVLSNWNQLPSDLDRVFAVRRAISEFKLDEKIVVEEILPALGLEPQKHFLEECRQMADLDPSVLEAIHAGLLPFRGANVLARFSKADQAEFIKQAARPAALTTNQLLKAGEWLFDLLKLKGGSLEAFLQSSGLQKNLEIPSQDRRQKGERFCSELRALRFPELVRKEKDFQSAAAQIQTDPAIALEPPSYFEGEGMTLRARLRNPEAVDRLAEVLERKRKLFKSLFDIML